jgi:hypothetical protein
VRFKTTRVEEGKKELEFDLFPPSDAALSGRKLITGEFEVQGLRFLQISGLLFVNCDLVLMIF